MVACLQLSTTVSCGVIIVSEASRMWQLDSCSGAARGRRYSTPHSEVALSDTKQNIRVLDRIVGSRPPQCYFVGLDVVPQGSMALSSLFVIFLGTTLPLLVFSPACNSHNACLPWILQRRWYFQMVQFVLTTICSLYYLFLILYYLFLEDKRNKESERHKWCC